MRLENREESPLLLYNGSKFFMKASFLLVSSNSVQHFGTLSKEKLAAQPNKNQSTGKYLINLQSN
jgi:hypothetical protein